MLGIIRNHWISKTIFQKNMDFEFVRSVLQRFFLNLISSINYVLVNFHQLLSSSLYFTVYVEIKRWLYFITLLTNNASRTPHVSK